MKRIFTLTWLIVALLACSAYADPGKGKCSRATGNTAIAATYTATSPTDITSVRIHFSAAATQDVLMISVDSGRGSTYDTLLVSQDMTGYSDLVYFPDQRLLLESSDAISIAFDNNDTVTYGLEVCYEN